jgi:hypothetical protein
VFPKSETQSLNPLESQIETRIPPREAEASDIDSQDHESALEDLCVIVLFQRWIPPVTAVVKILKTLEIKTYEKLGAVVLHTCVRRTRG